MASGLITFFGGVAIGLVGFFRFATHQADANNTWMLQQLADPHGAGDSAALVPYGMSMLTPLMYLFTPTGLLALYLVVSGSARGISAWFEEPRGDPLLSTVDWAAATLAAKRRGERRRTTRERLEGPEAPDVLRTGDWAGLPGVDYIVLSSRRKPEWNAGAIILTSAEWYRLGVPFDLETPMGLRTAYPLTRLDTPEVVRRGIQYELPALRGRG